MTSREKAKHVHEIPSAEWAVGALGFVLVLCLIIYFLVQALGRPRTPPQISVNVDSVATRAGVFVVELSARNLGSRTAAQVVIEGELQVGESLERREIVLDYLPERSIRRAALVFRHDPRRGELRVLPVSYREP